MNYAKIYEILVSGHSFFPYYFGVGRGWPPVRVQFELTYRCNLHCPMCYQEKIYQKGEKELTKGEWIKLIKQLPRFCLITLIGGEPLVRTDFKEIAEYALSSHPVNLVTNGVLLSPQINSFLIKKKLLLLGVSLDGVGKIHDQMRGAEGAYQKVIKNLTDLQKQKREKAAKFPLLDIKTLVAKTNLANLWKLFEIVRDLEADFFTISLPKVSNDQFNPKLKDDFAQLSGFDFTWLGQIDFVFLRKVLRKIAVSSGRTKIRFYPQFNSIEKISRNLYNQKTINQCFFSCRQPWSGVQISATGHVYPCLSLNLGNIKEKSFAEIWNGKKFRHFRRKLKSSKLFPACLGCCYLKQR